MSILKSLAQRVRTAFNTWAAKRAEARADAQFWNAALNDARIMADISRAMSQQAVEQGRELGGARRPVASPATREATRRFGPMPLGRA